MVEFLALMALLFLYALYEKKQWEKELKELKLRRFRKQYFKAIRAFGRSKVVYAMLGPVILTAMARFQEFERAMKAVQALVGPTTYSTKDPTRMSDEELKSFGRKDA